MRRMQEKQLYEYAVIRVVPQVEREEFLNAGVILYCPGQRFLQTLYEVNEARLHAVDSRLDLEEVRARLYAFEQVCAGREQGGPIGRLPIASRFRWLTASRSTIVQSSPVHPGLCADPLKTLERLFKQLVAS